MLYYYNHGFIVVECKEISFFYNLSSPSSLPFLLVSEELRVLMFDLINCNKEFCGRAEDSKLRLFMKINSLERKEDVKGTIVERWVQRHVFL